MTWNSMLSRTSVFAAVLPGASGYLSQQAYPFDLRILTGDLRILTGDLRILTGALVGMDEALALKRCKTVANTNSVIGYPSAIASIAGVKTLEFEVGGYRQ